MKKCTLILSICLGFSLLVSAQTPKEDITLVLVPRVEPALQIGQDLASRYPVLLVSYLTAANGTVSLHGWTGTQWVNIKVENYESGDFFKKGPSSALIIENDSIKASDKLIPAEEWCGDVTKITTTQLRPLLHLVGRYYDFNHKDWKWFSKRYNQSEDAINPEGLNISWYHKRLNEHLQQSGWQGSSDLQYWQLIRKAMVLDDQVEEEIELVVVEEEVTMESVNPLTNDVPSAVVMGAGNVPEEQSTEEVIETNTEEVLEDKGAESAEEM